MKQKPEGRQVAVYLRKLAEDAVVADGSVFTVTGMVNAGLVSFSRLSDEEKIRLIREVMGASEQDGFETQAARDDDAAAASAARDDKRRGRKKAAR